MDNAIPINDLKAVFGDYEKTLKAQTKVITDLYKILTGDKILPSTNRANSFYAKLNPEVAADREKKDEKEKVRKTEAAPTDNKKTREDTKKADDKKTIPQLIGAAIGSVLKSTTTDIINKDKNKQIEGKDTPYVRELINIEFTPKAKVELEDILYQNTVILVDKLKPYLEDIDKTVRVIKKDAENTGATSKKPGNSLFNKILTLLGLGELADLGLGGYLRKKIGDLFRWVGRSIWKSIKWVGSKAWDGIKRIAPKITDAIEELTEKMGTNIKSAFNNLKNPKWWIQGIKDLTEKMGTEIKSAFNALKDSKWWNQSIKELTEKMGTNIKSAFNNLKDSKWGQSIKELTEKMGTEIKGAFNALKNSKWIQGIKDLKWGQATKSLLKGTGELAEGVAKKGKFLKGKGGPIIGTAIAGGFEVYEGKQEVDTITAKQKAGLIGKDEAKKQKAEAIGGRSGKFVAQQAVGTAGAWAGAEGGAAAGTFIGSVVPVLGTAVGAVIGGIIGGFGGYMAGTSLSDASGLTKVGEEGGKKVAKKITGVHENKKPKDNNISTYDLRDYHGSAFKEGGDKKINLPAVQPTTPKTPSNNIQPVSQEVPSTVSPDINDNGPDMGDVHNTIKEQNKLIVNLIKINKQTAENTAALMSKNTANNVSITNVNNNPTAYLTNPVSSSDFRRKAFAQ